jgi:poly-beta-1,6-N-acetyl-D-glucosamine synthase
MTVLDLAMIAAAAFLTYTYIGYPTLIALLARYFPKPTENVLGQRNLDNDIDWPTVSIVLVAHNEELRIQEKLNNLAALDYPQAQLEIIVVSDGSSDQTASIARQSTHARVIAQSKRAGKAACLKLGVTAATGSLLFFVDVRQAIDRSALKKLVVRLDDLSVSIASGELIYRDAATQQGKNIGAYWRYEKWIRINESAFDSTVGVTGAIYLMRRREYPLIVDGAILDDFEVPMLVSKQHGRVVFEQGAYAVDYVQEDMEIEAKRKLRTLQGNFQALHHQLWLINPFAHRLFFQYFSHKFSRLIAPYFLMLLFLLSLLNSGVIAKTLLVCQLGFYGSALAAKLVPKFRQNKWAGLAYVFVAMNWSAVLGFVRFLTEPSDGKWEKT